MGVMNISQLSSLTFSLFIRYFIYLEVEGGEILGTLSCYSLIIYFN